MENDVKIINQQTKKITGEVIDASGIPIIGANIVVKGTTNGTITDMEGRFSLDVSDNAVLQVSYIGYNTQTIVVGNQTQFSIKLSENTAALEEVVVVGYGTQRKSDITSAVSVIDMKNIGDIPSVDPSRRQARGHRLTPSSGLSSQPSSYPPLG